MNNKIVSYKDLIVWQKGIDLVEKIYEITKLFPKEEQFGLAIQMKRAAVSVPSNIAEGFRRRYNKEYRQFLRVALGSCGELDTQVIIAGRLNFIDDQYQVALAELIDHISRMLVNLDKSLERS